MDSKLSNFQHLEKFCYVFDSMKHQTLGKFFIMIQVESMEALNIKVEVWYISFPKCPRTSIDLTWARSYGFINKACCNFVLRQIWCIFLHHTILSSLVINQDKQESLGLHNIFNIGSISQENITLGLKNHHCQNWNLSFILKHLCAIVDFIQNLTKGQVNISNVQKQVA